MNAWDELVEQMEVEDQKAKANALLQKIGGDK